MSIDLGGPGPSPRFYPVALPLEWVVGQRDPTACLALEQALKLNRLAIGIFRGNDRKRIIAVRRRRCTALSLLFITLKERPELLAEGLRITEHQSGPV